MKCPECLGDMIKVTCESKVKAEGITEEELAFFFGTLKQTEMYLCRNCGILFTVMRMRPSGEIK